MGCWVGARGPGGRRLPTPRRSPAGRRHSVGLCLPATSSARHARRLQVLRSSLSAQAVKMLPAAVRLLLACLTTLAVLLPSVLANVEKTVFVAPPAVAIPNVRPGLQDLRLTSLSPSVHIFRTHIPVVFPSGDAPRGLESWFLLSGLKEGQRYEVRICWAATVCCVKCPCFVQSAHSTAATDYLLAGRSPHRPSLRDTRAHHGPCELFREHPRAPAHCRRRKGPRSRGYIRLTSFPAHPGRCRLLQHKQDAHEQPA